MKAKGKDKKMVRRGLKVNLTLWERAKEKAGLIPISAIVRRLLERWVKGEIDLDS